MSRIFTDLWLIEITGYMEEWQDRQYGSAPIPYLCWEEDWWLLPENDQYRLPEEAS